MAGVTTSIYHRGQARGGPRNGVVITASARWDGRIAARKDVGRYPLYHVGYYTWLDGCWTWLEEVRRVAC